MLELIERSQNTVTGWIGRKKVAFCVFNGHDHEFESVVDGTYN